MVESRDACLPYLGAVLSDMYFIDKGNSDVTPAYAARGLVVRDHAGASENESALKTSWPQFGRNYDII